MADLSTDRLVQIALGLAATAAAAYGTLQTQEHSTCQIQVDHWREELALERAAGQAREIRDSDLCQDLIRTTCAR